MSNATTALLKEAQENETIRSMYVKRNCRHCYGRGVIHRSISQYDPIFNLSEFVNRSELCQCVVKTIKKESKRGQNVKTS
jgi:hypothetical protein